VVEALSLASKQLTQLDRVKFRVFKAGTGTFLYLKKTTKQKNLEQAQKNLPRLPIPNGPAWETRTGYVPPIPPINGNINIPIPYPQRGIRP
jgi:hypothetical protein